MIPMQEVSKILVLAKSIAMIKDHIITEETFTARSEQNMLQ